MLVPPLRLKQNKFINPKQETKIVQQTWMIQAVKFQVYPLTEWGSLRVKRYKWRKTILFGLLAYLAVALLKS